MQGITKTYAAPGKTEPSAKMEGNSKGTAIPNVSSEDKNISFETPFQDRKVGSQPCMSFLPAMGSPLSRSQKENTESKKASDRQLLPETSADRMRETVRKFRESLMYSVPSIVREQAVDTLSLLIRFDQAIGMDDAKVLIEAVRIINKAGVAHT
jgi:hypothetical protein